MKRNSKILKTAIAAFIMMSVVTASASAAEFYASETPASLTAESSSAGQVLTTETGEVTCTEVEATGAISSSPTSSLKLSPSYGGSKAFGENLENACVISQSGETLRGFVEFNSCVYVLGAAGEVVIECEGEDTVEVTATSFKLPCYEIDEQTLSGTSYMNNGNHIDIEAEVGEIAYSASGACGSEAEGTASYAGEITVAADNEASEAVNLDYKSPPPPAEFFVDEIPAFLTGSAITNQVFTFAVGESFQCSEVELAGTIETNPTGVIEAAPTYGGSETFGQGIENPCELHISGETLRLFVNVNSCIYIFHGDGDLDIVCEPEDQIDLRVSAFKLGCYNISAQELAGVSYSNNGEHLDLGFNIAGVAVESTGVCGEGSREATYVGEITAAAENELAEPVDLDYE